MGGLKWEETYESALKIVKYATVVNAIGEQIYFRIWSFALHKGREGVLRGGTHSQQASLAGNSALFQGAMGTWDYSATSVGLRWEQNTAPNLPPTQAYML